MKNQKTSKNPTSQPRTNSDSDKLQDGLALIGGLIVGDLRKDARELKRLKELWQSAPIGENS